MKKYNAMSKMFDPIKAAGQKGDISKAKDAYDKVSVDSIKTSCTTSLYKWYNLALTNLPCLYFLGECCC